MIRGNVNQQDQSYVNTMRFLDWFESSHGVVTIRPILMYYAIEIDSSLFLSGSFWVVSEIFSPSFPLILDVDLSSLFIVMELSHRV
jgi:hypothetical protein